MVRFPDEVPGEPRLLDKQITWALMYVFAQIDQMRAGGSVADKSKKE